MITTIQSFKESLNTPFVLPSIIKKELIDCANKVSQYVYFNRITIDQKFLIGFFNSYNNDQVAYTEQFKKLINEYLLSNKKPQIKKLIISPTNGYSYRLALYF